MVALATYRLNYIPKPGLAKPILFAALERFDQEDLIGAGARLREAVFCLLQHGCDWYGCPPKGNSPRARDYAKALLNASHITEPGFNVLLEIIDIGNRAAYSQRVEPHEVKSGIDAMFDWMEAEPYAGHDRKPIATSYAGPYSFGGDDGCDEDDDSAANQREGGDA